MCISAGLSQDRGSREPEQLLRWEQDGERDQIGLGLSSAVL